MVLADDVDNDGTLDLVVSTMNGNIYLLGTETPFYPLKAWPSQTHGMHGLNGFTASEGYMGVRIAEESRVHRDVVGWHFKLMFEIVDHRGPGSRRPHKVVITAGHQVLHTRLYFRTGTYVEMIPTPTERVRTTLKVTMLNELGQEFEDTMPISFNMNFHLTIKWLVVLPFTVLVVVMSFHTSTNRVEPTGEEGTIT
eukprot:NODE_4606_length_767_cov_66.493750_g4583_i0.p1 GENE.NODE_4606_length_767_cov_66.493750_g4583_i0~~NODE_4606_length_767_cov_66.493750_g4583_i0.p1  ORF type:complete len:215 (+),score=66.20 NODE_4606_length_767_cov_66.493750_g4583_i0:58-645(+)